MTKKHMYMNMQRYHWLLNHYVKEVYKHWQNPEKLCNPYNSLH